MTWLFFDMGSTLIDETDSYKRWFSNAAQLTGGALTADDIEREYCAGMARYAPTISGQLRPYGYTGNSTADLYPSELDKPYPGAQSVLEQLSKLYKLGIIANQVPGAKDRLTHYGLWSYFTIVLASAEVGISKPDPRIFTLALRQANCSPEQAVMIGDRPDNDIYPAKKLGMRTIRIKQGLAAYQEPRTKEYEADVSVESLEEVARVVMSCRLARKVHHDAAIPHTPWAD